MEYEAVIFDLLTALGSGAFAQVFLARQRSMQRLVALKVSADQGTEAQTLAQLDHPHIVRVYDQKVVPGGGMRLLYMPYLAGGTLQSVLEHARAVPADKRSGKTLIEAIDRVLQRRGEEPPVDSPLRSRLSELSWPQAVAWLGARLADALHYAHRRGVLHRDIKPANIMLGPFGETLVVDWGLARPLNDETTKGVPKLTSIEDSALSGNDSPALTQDGMALGTPAYMSPEQAAGQLKSLGPASDIYSLGATLYVLLTGRSAFTDREINVRIPADDRGCVSAKLHRRALHMLSGQCGKLLSDNGRAGEGDFPDHGVRDEMLRDLRRDAEHQSDDSRR